MNASPRRSGVALVAVMWVVTIAGLILLGVYRHARLNVALAYGQLHQVQAHWLARAGVERAIAVLDDDGTTVDSKKDYWYDDPYSFEEIELATGYQFSVVAAPSDEDELLTKYRYGLVDASSRVNINVVDEKQLKELMPLESRQIAAIADWIDGDRKLRPGGAEQGHYDRLDFPYQVRNGELATLDELLLVRGIDVQMFYGEDANLNGLLDKNEDDGFASAPDDNSDGRLDHGLAQLTTLYASEINRTSRGDKRVNLNEADENTLRDRLNLTKALAKQVVARKGNPKFKTVFDLLEVKANKPAGEKGKEEKDRVNEFTMEWIADNLDLLTLSKDELIKGRINVNTASRQVLMSLPQMNEPTADAIIAHRSSAQGPLYGVGELFTSNLVDKKQFRQIAERLTVRSHVFYITSRGRRIGGIEQTIEAIVTRTTSPPTIVYWYQSE